MAETAATPVPDAPEAIDPNFRIELPNFEGPLDLLLHLIRTHELDILDLPIAFVTERYLEYLKMMGELNLDLASEYLVMAATLAHIKSKMLLPKPPADQDDDVGDEIDPRTDLIRRLLEYQKYKLVAEDLGRRGIAGRDVFRRGTPRPSSGADAPLADTGVFKLIDALQKVAKRLRSELSLEVDAERITIQARMGEMLDTLKTQRACSFEELFEDVTTNYDLVVTFLALLEMAKMRIISVYQTDHEEPIHIEYVLLDEEGQPIEPADLTAALTAPGEPPRESVVVPAMSGSGGYRSEGEPEA